VIGAALRGAGLTEILLHEADFTDTTDDITPRSIRRIGMIRLM
jgi:hypothetical protein